MVVSSPCWRFLLLNRSFLVWYSPIHLFLLLPPLAFEVKFIKSSLSPRSLSFIPMFFSMHFIVSGLIFRPLIHFELMLVCGDRQQSSYILLQVAFQFSQHHLLKRLSFLYCTFLPFSSKNYLPSKYEFTSRLLILFHWLMCLFFWQYHGFLNAVTL